MKNPNRRHFLSVALGTIAALPLTVALSRIFGDTAQAAETLKETDPTAQALGYKADATKVDLKKYPKRAGADGPKQFCWNCALYQAKTANPKDSAEAPCLAMGGKIVSGKGWCNSWAKNPKVTL